MSKQPDWSKEFDEQFNHFRVGALHEYGKGKICDEFGSENIKAFIRAQIAKAERRGEDKAKAEIAAKEHERIEKTKKALKLDKPVLC